MTLDFASRSVKLASPSSTAAPTPSQIVARKAVGRAAGFSSPAGDPREPESVTGMRLLHCRRLLQRGAALIFGLPGLVGHAVDRLAALVLGERNAFLVGGVLQPVRKAVAAEARQIHQVDILNIGPLAQMPYQTPEGGSFEFRSGLVIDRHDQTLVLCQGVWPIG